MYVNWPDSRIAARNGGLDSERQDVRRISTENVPADLPYTCPVIFQRIDRPKSRERDCGTFSTTICRVLRDGKTVCGKSQVRRVTPFGEHDNFS